MRSRRATVPIRVWVALMVLLTAASAQQWPAPRPPQRRTASPGSPPTFQVNVKLVNVLTSVVDSEGAPYTGLRKEDFRIFDDGVEQKPALFERQSALPLSIIMAMDTSLSTHKDLELEIASGRTFAKDILRPVDVIAVYAFSTYVFQMLPFTNDEHRVERALDRLREGSATALYDAIVLGARALERRQGRKVIVLITDGGDTASKSDYPDALRAAQSAEAIIYPIIMVPIEADAGRDTGGEHALIQLSQDTGGKYFYASSLAQLDEAFRQIGEELRTQYLLAYYPPSRQQPGFHRITIELTPEAREKAQRPLTLHDRAGYYSNRAQ